MAFIMICDYSNLRKVNQLAKIVIGCLCIGHWQSDAWLNADPLIPLRWALIAAL
jgi:hypothetical protein